MPRFLPGYPLSELKYYAGFNQEVWQLYCRHIPVLLILEYIWLISGVSLEYLWSILLESFRKRGGVNTFKQACPAVTPPTRLSLK
jgi:hypothetical protein